MSKAFGNAVLVTKIPNKNELIMKLSYYFKTINVWL